MSFSHALQVALANELLEGLILKSIDFQSKVFIP